MKSDEHRRAPETVLIPLSQIRMDEQFPEDRRLISLILKAEAGADVVALTRIRDDQIATGFYERVGSEVVHNTFYDESYVQDIVANLRRGHRPVLLVYWNSHAPGPWKYVCSDDELTLAAYRAAGIPMIPCQILRPRKTKRGVGEVWVRSGEKRIIFNSILPASSPSVSTVFGEKRIGFPYLIRKLREYCKETLRLIEEFHEDAGGGISYHHMLHAAVLRHERTLDSIRHLVRRGRHEHAGALARLAYEAYLNFYLDWLSPEFFGPRLQLLARIRDSLSGSPDKEEAERNLRSLEYIKEFVPIFESTLEKARVSSLTEQFYRMFYPRFSLIAHQSYSGVEFDSTRQDAAGDEAFVAQLGRWLDAITTSLLVCVRNDVGKPVARAA